MKKLTTLFRKPLFLFLLFAFPYLGISQVTKYRTFTEFVTLQNRTAKERDLIMENNIEGSAYLNKNFVLGSVITKDHIYYQEIPLRYNIYNDDIEFKTTEDEYLAISEPNSLAKVIIGNDFFIYTKNPSNKNDQSGYYQLLSDGEIQLLSRFRVSYREAVASDGIAPAQSAKFVQGSNTFYLRIKDNAPIQISKKKDIQSIFGDQSKQIMTYVKKEKINLRKKDQLIKLVEYLNQTN